MLSSRRLLNQNRMGKYFNFEVCVFLVYNNGTIWTGPVNWNENIEYILNATVSFWHKDSSTMCVIDSVVCIGEID